MSKITGVQERSIVSREQDGRAEIITDMVAEEVAIALVYNGVTHAVMMATPANLEDFALGFSLTEGIIDVASDLDQVEIRTTKQGLVVEIKINPAKAKRLKDRQRSLSGRAGCGICGLTDIAAAVPNLPSINPQIPPSHDAVNRATKALEQQQTLQQTCGGVHGAALSTHAGELLIVREDVGRHNALDKLIGAALLANPTQPFSDQDFILMSSRASHELVNKAVIAGASSLVTLSAATTLAISVANKTNLNLIGFIRGNRQLVYYQNPT